MLYFHFFILIIIIFLILRKTFIIFSFNRKEKKLNKQKSNLKLELKKIFEKQLLLNKKNGQ